MHIHRLTGHAGTAHSFRGRIRIGHAVHVLQIVVYSVVDLPSVPLGIQGGVLRRHGGCGELSRTARIRVPAAKGVTRSAQVIGARVSHSRAKTICAGVGGFTVCPSGIAAVQVIGQRILVTGVIHLDHRAAVALDGLLRNTLRCGKSGVGLTFGGGKLTRSAGLGFFVRKGIVIVRHILLIMLHGVGDTALRCPLGVEGDIVVGHGDLSNRSRAVCIRVPTIKGVTRSRHIALRQEVERSAQTIGFNTGVRNPCCVLGVQVISQAVPLAGIADGNRSAVLCVDGVLHRFRNGIDVFLRLCKELRRIDGNWFVRFSGVRHGRLRPLAVCALLPEHKEIVDIDRHPLGKEGKVLGRHGRCGKLVLVVFVRIPTAKGIAKTGGGIVQLVKLIAIAIGHSAYLTIVS